MKYKKFALKISVHHRKVIKYAMDNEKCITRDLGFTNWKFLKLTHLKIHIRYVSLH